MTTKTASVIIGLLFIVVGISGFVPNPIVGESEDVIFHADTVHSLVHIISGILFLIVAFALPSASRTFLVIFGIIYFLIGLLGITKIGEDGMATVLGFLHVNGPDNYLHIGLGVIIFLAGMLRTGS